MDCDEVYNYWEPLHYILYQNGFQTWEYHYVYALRTYSYLVPLQYITKYILLQQPFVLLYNSIDKVSIFLLLRQAIAFFTACNELFFIYALLQYYKNNNNQQHNNVSSSSSSSSITIIPYCTAILLLTCTGMNHASSAFLPSATWIAIWCNCTACYLLQYHILFIIIAIIGTLTTGWPFGCICIIPLSIHILYKEIIQHRRPVRFITSIIIITIFVQGIVTYIDTIHYGTITFPTLNIFRYNASNNNDTLYGVEPISYYMKNLLLNCNIMSLLGCLAIPIYIINYILSHITKTNNAIIMSFDIHIIMILLSLPIWFSITLFRPHKEERFMFPIYPVLIFGSVLCIDIIISFLIKIIRYIQKSNVTKANSISFYKIIGHACIWIPVIVLSMSRTYALYKYYHAPIDIYQHLSSHLSSNNHKQLLLQETNSDMVCTCGEWYRYPSSFFLPEYTIQIPIGFLQSSFTGQLPQPFTQYGSKYDSIQLLQPFNDQNMEHKERYVTNITRCTYLIDISDSNDCRSQFENILSTNTTQSLHMTTIISKPFLSPDRTKSFLHRILYIPYYHEYAYEIGQISYNEYILYHIKHDK